MKQNDKTRQTILTEDNSYPPPPLKYPPIKPMGDVLIGYALIVLSLSVLIGFGYIFYKLSTRFHKKNTIQKEVITTVCERVCVCK